MGLSFWPYPCFDPDKRRVVPRFWSIVLVDHGLWFFVDGVTLRGAPPLCPSLSLSPPLTASSNQRRTRTLVILNPSPSEDTVCVGAAWSRYCLFRLMLSRTKTLYRGSFFNAWIWLDSPYLAPPQKTIPGKFSVGLARYISYTCTRQKRGSATRPSASLSRGYNPRRAKRTPTSSVQDMHGPFGRA